MLESSVGAYHCLAPATLPNFRYPADIFPSERFYRPDLAEPPMHLCGPSQVRALEAPGCGAAPHSRRLEEQTLDYALLKR